MNRRTYSCLAIARRHPRLFSTMLRVGGPGDGWSAHLGPRRTADYGSANTAIKALLKGLHS